MEVGVLVPARNEARSLSRVLGGLRAALPGARVLVVDGHSEDDTVAVALAFGAEVLRQPGRGYADALAEGYRALAGWPIQAALQLDADGQHPPEAAPGLLAALADGDVVFGSRQGTGIGGARLRRAGSALLSASVALGTGRWLHDVMSGFWACSPRAVAVFAERLPRDVADANARVIALRAGLGVLERPVIMAPRLEGESMHAGWGGLRNGARSLGAVWRAAR